MKIFIWFILLTFMIFSPLLAQEKEPENYDAGVPTYWISSGIGNSYFGPTFKADISFSFYKSIFTIRYFTAQEFQFAAGDHQFDDPPIKIKEFGLLYGLSLRQEVMVANFTAGLAYVNGIMRGKQLDYVYYEAVKISNISIPLEANFRIEFNKYIAIGGSFFSNLNYKRSFVGWSAEICIGKLR